MLALKTHQSKFAFNVDRDRNMILHTLHAIGDEGPSDLTSTHKDFDWKPTVTEKNQIQKRCRNLFDEFLDSSAMNVDVKKGGVKILSLDGGGIRGLVLFKILNSLFKFTKQPIPSMFDWIIGTSTGGISQSCPGCWEESHGMPGPLLQAEGQGVCGQEAL